MNDEPRQAQQDFANDLVKTWAESGDAHSASATSERPDRASGDGGTLWSALDATTDFIEEWSNYWSYALDKPDDAEPTADDLAKAELLGHRSRDFTINNRRLLARTKGLAVGHDASSEPPPNTPNAVDAVAVREALAELVRLENLRKLIEFHMNESYNQPAGYADLCEEYEVKKPLAWERARALIGEEAK